MHEKSGSFRLAALLGAAAVALAGCAESDRDDQAGGSDGESSEATGGTFVFAASSDPVSLDPAFASDGETFRVARQIFEGLVGTEPGTADPAPLLATEWETSDDGLSTPSPCATT
jgi:peptide/nickel transport system substrate-binding protein